MKFGLSDFQSQILWGFVLVQAFWCDSQSLTPFHTNGSLPLEARAVVFSFPLCSALPNSPVLLLLYIQLCGLFCQVLGNLLGYLHDVSVTQYPWDRGIQGLPTLPSSLELSLLFICPHALGTFYLSDSFPCSLGSTWSYLIHFACLGVIVRAYSVLGHLSKAYVPLIPVLGILVWEGWEKAQKSAFSQTSWVLLMHMIPRPLSNPASLKQKLPNFLLTHGFIEGASEYRVLPEPPRGQPRVLGLPALILSPPFLLRKDN